MEITEFSIGDVVLCDMCNKDYTNSDEVGGFLFGSKAVCPCCAPRMMKDIVKYEEESFIKAKAKEGESFRAFILDLRGPRGGVVTVASTDDSEEFFELLFGKARG